MQDVDPPDLTLWPTLRHLYPLWREQWRLVAVGLVCALAFTGLSLAIPILIQRTIDNAIDGGDTSLLLPYLGADPRDRGAPLRRSTSPAATRPRASGSPSRRACAG